MRDSATWAYHGGGRSWGDVGNNGKYLATFGTGSQDRGQMHYRAGLNMIPLLEWYRKHPDDFFTLQVRAPHPHPSPATGRPGVLGASPQTRKWRCTSSIGAALVFAIATLAEPPYGNRLHRSGTI